MLNYESILMHQEVIDGRTYQLRMFNRIDSLEFIIYKRYNNVTSILFIRNFKVCSMTNKTVRAKKKIVRKEFFEYVNNLRELKEGGLTNKDGNDNIIM